MIGLKSRLIEHEGYKTHPYTCTAGKVTIGVGHNLTDRGLPDFIIDKLLDHDIEIATEDLSVLDPNWQSYSGARQQALVELSFIMGRGRLSGFQLMWAAIKRDEPDWNEAADQLLDSKFATQVGQRAQTLADLLRNG